MRLTNVDGIERIGDLGPVDAVAGDLGDQVRGGGVQRLIRLADLVALLDPLVGPALALGGRGRLRVVDAVLGPLDGEAGVEQPARVERGRGVVDHRERRDRGEVGRPGGADEELADPAVGDAGHPDPVVQHPGLAGDGLHDVVAVEALQPLEVVEGAAGAAGAAHVHVDDGVAEQVEDLADAALGPGRVGVAVARVLDQRSGRGRRRRGPAASRRPRGWSRPAWSGIRSHPRAASGCRSTASFGAERSLITPTRHGERAVSGTDPVALAGRDPAEENAAEAADGLLGNRLALARPAAGSSRAGRR